jgi:hypothetical protein
MQSRVVPEGTVPTLLPDDISLAGDNATVAEISQKVLEQNFPGFGTVHAKDDVKRSSRVTTEDMRQLKLRLDTDIFPETLSLAMGAPVVVTKNPAARAAVKGVVNGTLGTVVSFNEDAIAIKLEDGRTVTLGREQSIKWLTGAKASITRSMFP